MSDDIDRLVAFHCAPKLMGYKAGNLFSLKREIYWAQEEKMKSILAMLQIRGLSTQVFHGGGSSVLIYLYREELLEKNLSLPLSRSLLSAYGYVGEGVEELVRQLKQRVEESDAFPHEIGLFLGYPPEDVAGFVKHKGAACKFCGCWKVYGDVGRARSLFGQYAYCRNACCRCLRNGMTLEQVVQAV